jgi:hypothetical protein
VSLGYSLLEIYRHDRMDNHCRFVRAFHRTILTHIVWRGNMGYRSSDLIPRNWNMTTLDPARIEARDAELRLAMEARSNTS